MDTQQAALLHLLAAALLANLPFARGHAIPRRPWRDCALWLGAYLAWMGAAALFERTLGAPRPGRWETWAVTCALFAVAAFPGITWRYVLRRTPHD